ncbi:hypothetical protein [Pseudomonas coronafaciens]|uniref:hypothetical protein n=1 Tax=Pseudomonas coronafaciens TaxID=53409 RepID=UPI0011C463E4|nr:hypothetical protein [Pseudomonas coronafaciens]
MKSRIFLFLLSSAVILSITSMWLNPTAVFNYCVGLLAPWADVKNPDFTEPLKVTFLGLWLISLNIFIFSLVFYSNFISMDKAAAKKLDKFSWAVIYNYFQWLALAMIFVPKLKSDLDFYDVFTYCLLFLARFILVAVLAFFSASVLSLIIWFVITKSEPLVFKVAALINSLRDNLLTDHIGTVERIIKYSTIMLIIAIVFLMAKFFVWNNLVTIFN